MKFISALSALLLLMACGDGAGDPGDAVLDMFVALQAGDGEKAVSYMSSSALEEMEATLDEIRAEPEAAVYLSMMGIDLDASELEDLDARGFMVLLIESPMISGIMASVEVEIGEVSIDGETAMVEVTTTAMGETETNTIPVVLENGQWKVTEFEMNL
jgi:hypothetical protein